MVGDQFGDVRLRIEESRDLVREVMEAVQQSKSLVIEVRASLAKYRVEALLRESDSGDEAAISDSRD
jgi:hypothetical protein